MKSKKECLDMYFELGRKFSDEVYPRLDKLVEEDKITSGAAYIVLNVQESHGYKMIGEMLSRASKSKSYIRYLKRMKVWDYNYYIGDMQKVIDKAIAFCDEQEALPFEQTQKQLLKAAGELKGN